MLHYPKEIELKTIFCLLLLPRFVRSDAGLVGANLTTRVALVSINSIYENRDR